jgi:very-short-patch-repair endonuclease
MDPLCDCPEVFLGRDRGVGWTRVSYGLYAARKSSRELAHELRAWALVLPTDAGFTHLSAAALRGWWLPEPVPHPVFAALQEDGFCPRRKGLLATRHRELPAIELIDGVRVTSGAETLLAAARDLGVLDLVLMADSALRLGHTTVHELELVAGRGRRGGPMLRTVIPLLNKKSESPWESVMRVLHRAAGIDVEPQHHIFDTAGQIVARADLWLVGTKRIHEYDGADHRGKDVHRGDLTRDRRLMTIGWERQGFVAADLLYDGASAIRSADQVLGRAWDGLHLRRWNALIAGSLFSPIGRIRALSRWGCSGPPKKGAR